MKGRIIAAFAVVYLVWGSTYLGIRWAVETIPPFAAHRDPIPGGRRAAVCRGSLARRPRPGPAPGSPPP